MNSRIARTALLTSKHAGHDDVHRPALVKSRPAADESTAWRRQVLGSLTCSACCRCPRRTRGSAASLSARSTATAGLGKLLHPTPPAGRKQVLSMQPSFSSPIHTASPLKGFRSKALSLPSLCLVLTECVEMLSCHKLCQPEVRLRLEGSSAEHVCLALQVQLQAESAGSSGAPEPSQAMRPPDGAHEGPRLTAEITCSPLRVLTGQGPDLNR